MVSENSETLLVKENTIVLILVLVEDGLGVYIVSALVLSAAKVLILVLVEDGLGEV